MGNTQVPVQQMAEKVQTHLMDKLGPFGIVSCTNFEEFNLIGGLLPSYEVVYKSKKYSGILSPQSPITLPPKVKEAAKIPQLATDFIWGYPSSSFECVNQPTTPEQKFLSYGGYVYVCKDKILGINAIQDGGGQDLLFKGPYIFHDVLKVEELRRCNRLQKVNIPSLQEKGVEDYCWLLPGEKQTDGTVICSHGAFVYIHDNGSFYFKVKGSLKTDEEIQDNTLIWEYQSETSGEWMTYDTKSRETLETAYLTDQEQVTITIIQLGETNQVSEVQYKVNLVSKTNIFSCENSNRKLRRIDYGSTRGEAIWSYKMRKKFVDNWINFYPESNKVTEELFVKSLVLRDPTPSLINITVITKEGNKQSTTYKLNFQEMIQTNVETGHPREICRNSKKINKPHPPLVKIKKIASVQRMRKSHSEHSKLSCYGVIAIYIKAAKDLAVVSLGACDSFVVVTTNFSPFFWKSQIRLRTVNPEWNETVNMNVGCDSLENAMVTFTFYHHRLVQKDLYLGKMSISLFDIVKNKKMSGWRQLDFECREKNPQTDPASLEFSISFDEGPPPSFRSISLCGDENVNVNTTSTFMVGTQSSYELTEILGEGSFATVKKGINTKDKSLVAVKIIKKEVREDFFDQISIEIKIMMMVKNEYCVSMVDFIHNVNDIFIAMDFCSGGDMLDALLNKKLIGEDKIKIVIKHILLGLKYLHENYICHRDIKPENILQHLETGIWKITDFGISAFFTKDNPYIQGRQGTGQYMAPEIFSEKYTKTVDLWSCGIVVYVSLTGNMPWPSSGDLEEFITKSYIEFPSEIKISKLAKDFVYHLLENRSIEESLGHKWMNTKSG